MWFRVDTGVSGFRVEPTPGFQGLGLNPCTTGRRLFAVADIPPRPLTLNPERLARFNFGTCHLSKVRHNHCSHSTFFYQSSVAGSTVEGANKPLTVGS
jgi:hypothetical protein